MKVLVKTVLRLAIVLSVLLMLAGSGSLLAQSGRGTINGTVLDSAGALVPGAKITVTDPATGASSTTESSEAGTYTVPDLPVGTYTIRAEKQGFKAIIRSGITLNSASTIRVDFTLEIGEVRQEIEVTGDVSMVKTEETKISSTVSNLMIQQLPLVVGGALRSPFDLATLTPEAKLYATQIALQPGPNNLSPVQDSLQIGGANPAPTGLRWMACRWASATLCRIHG